MTAPPPPAAPTVSNSSRNPKDQPAARSRQAEAHAPAPTWTPLPRMKPHRTLFIVLLLAWVAWCGVMIAMYFTTVRPHPQPSQPRPATAPVVA